MPGMFTILTNFYADSIDVASAGSGTLNSNATSGVAHVAGVDAADGGGTLFGFTAGWTAANSAGAVASGWGCKTMIIKYDNSGGGTANLWIQAASNFTSAGTSAIIIPGNGLLMQPGDELVLDYDRPQDFYACVQQGSGTARLSYAVLG